MKKNKMSYGAVDILPAKIDPKDVTVHISVKMEGDLLLAIKAEAKEKGLPYQTLMKQMLRQQLKSGSVDDLGDRVRQLEKSIEELREGYARLSAGRKLLGSLTTKQKKRT